MNERIKYLVGRVLSVLRVSSKSNSIKAKVKKTSAGFGADTFNNMFGAQEVYDRMKVKCHPDRFAGDVARQRKATEIFQLMVQNKNNYNELLKLEKRMNNELFN